LAFKVQTRREPAGAAAKPQEATDAALGRLLKPDKSMASLGIKPS
jgi:hypothetical protein